MKHLMNRLSGRNLCEVRRPAITQNVTDTGLIFMGKEKVCIKCLKYWPEYEEKIMKPFYESKWYKLSAPTAHPIKETK